MSPEVERLVRTLELSAHPEGGFYREIYRSTETVTRDALPSRFAGPRAFATAIYFLVPAGTFSALHDIASDECWHHYEGDPLRVVTLHPILTEFARELAGEAALVEGMLQNGVDPHTFEPAPKQVAAARAAGSKADGVWPFFVGFVEAVNPVTEGPGRKPEVVESKKA